VREVRWNLWLEISCRRCYHPIWPKEIPN